MNSDAYRPYRCQNSPAENKRWEDLIIEVLTVASLAIGFDNLLEQVKEALVLQSSVLPSDYVENNIRQAIVRLQGRGLISLMHGNDDSIRLIAD